MRRALWIRAEDGVELDEDPEADEEFDAVMPFAPSPVRPAPAEDDEMEEGEEPEEGEVVDDEPATGPEGEEGQEGENRDKKEEMPRAPKRAGREKGRRNSRGGWELEETERAAMRRERERCLVGDGNVSR